MRKYLAVIPAVLFPYIIILELLCIFTGNFLMEAVFQHNLLLLLIIPVVFWGAAMAGMIVQIRKTQRQGQSGQDLAKMNLVVKAIQIPAYGALFICGVLFLLTVFTFAFSFVLVIFDGMAICLTGILGGAAAWRCRREGILSRKQAAFCGCLQFIFCLDIFAALWMYRRAKKQRSNVQNAGRQPAY